MISLLRLVKTNDVAPMATQYPVVRRDAGGFRLEAKDSEGASQEGWSAYKQSARQDPEGDGITDRHPGIAYTDLVSFN